MPLVVFMFSTYLMTKGIPFMGLVQFVVGIVFAIASFRYVIKGQKIEHWIYWSWDMDAWRMVGYMILEGIVASLGIVFAALMFFFFCK